MHLILPEYLLYVLSSGKNMYKGAISLLFLKLMKYLIILFTKRKLIRYYYFINILLFIKIGLLC